MQEFSLHLCTHSIQVSFFEPGKELAITNSSFCQRNQSLIDSESLKTMGTKHCQRCQNTFSIQNLNIVARREDARYEQNIIHESPKHLAESSRTCESCLYLIKAFLSQYRKPILPGSQIANDAQKDDLIQKFLDCTANAKGTQLRISHIQNTKPFFSSLEGGAEPQSRVRSHNNPCNIVSIDLCFYGAVGEYSQSFTLYIDAYSGECHFLAVGG